ncbi:MAG: hypothetical protein RM021_029510 [Nostoc sp. EkiNYC01]|nr:hypothetical protein [Nostoc sp. EkiNYC01]
MQVKNANNVEYAIASPEFDFVTKSNICSWWLEATFHLSSLTGSSVDRKVLRSI